MAYLGDQSMKIFLSQHGSKFETEKEVSGHSADLVLILFTNVSKYLPVATQF